uniref:Uncharacterized protein n=1 Tax=Triticum urartu TaxID=4572 RepID=A0A8R7TG07_TRIUA
PAPSRGDLDPHLPPALCSNPPPLTLFLTLQGGAPSPHTLPSRASSTLTRRVPLPPAPCRASLSCHSSCSRRA